MSESGFLVVARGLDGSLVRGRTLDFRPERETFHVFEEGSSIPARVRLGDLKALFFVKSLRGDPSHVERKTFRHRRGVGQKVWVEFVDGEELAGWSVSLAPEKNGFFLFPTDANSNLKKVYILRHACRRVLQGEAAERAAREYRPPDSAARGPVVRPEVWEEFLGDHCGRPPDPARAPQPSDPRPRGRRRRRADSDIFLGDW